MASLVSAATTAVLSLTSAASNSSQSHGFTNSSGSVTAPAGTVTGSAPHWNVTHIYSQLDYTGPTTPIAEFHTFLSSSVEQASAIALTKEYASSCWSSFSSSVDKWSSQSFGQYNYSTQLSIPDAGITEYAYYETPAMTQGKNCYCSGCSIAGNSAKIMVWPTPAPEPAISSFVSNGNTFVSPSIYIDVHMGMWVHDKCGQRTSISSTMLSYESVPLYEIMWSGNFHEKSTPVLYSLDALQTTYTTEASANVSGTMFTRQCYVYTASDCPPQIQFPTAILEKYGWGDCSISGGNSGFYDPPQYLTPQNGLMQTAGTPAKATGNSPITSESPSPVPTAPSIPPLTSFGGLSTTEIDPEPSPVAGPSQAQTEERPTKSTEDPVIPQSEVPQQPDPSTPATTAHADQKSTPSPVSLPVDPTASDTPQVSNTPEAASPFTGDSDAPPLRITIDSQVFPIDPDSTQNIPSPATASDSPTDPNVSPSPADPVQSTTQLPGSNDIAPVIASALGLAPPASPSSSVQDPADPADPANPEDPEDPVDPVDPLESSPTPSDDPAGDHPPAGSDPSSTAPTPDGDSPNISVSADPSANPSSKPSADSPGPTPAPRPLTINGHTLTAGAAPATIAGVPVSLGDTAVVVGTKTIGLPPAAESDTGRLVSGIVDPGSDVTGTEQPPDGTATAVVAGATGAATGAGGNSAGGTSTGAVGSGAAAQATLAAEIASAVGAQATESAAPGKTSGGEDGLGGMLQWLGELVDGGESGEKDRNRTAEEGGSGGSGDDGSSGSSGSNNSGASVTPLGSSTAEGGAAAATGDGSAGVTGGSGSSSGSRVSGQDANVGASATSTAGEAGQSIPASSASGLAPSWRKAATAMVGVLGVRLGLHILL